MSFGASQDLAIELRTRGRNAIPVIKSGNIITIHGRNGVGKSMASTLLEIASGDYIFEDENKFEKLADIIESCEIKFHINGKFFYKVVLKPHLWSFDSNLNRVNPFTLGEYFMGEAGKEIKIDFEEFRKNIYVRTIRGNESLHQQILFFKDIFVAKIDQKLKKLNIKIDYLESYEDWFNRSEYEKLIEDYNQLQENYNDQLNQISNFKSSIENRQATLKNLNKSLDLLKKLLFLSENERDDLIKEKNLEEDKLEKIEKEIKKNYKKLSNIEQKIEEIKVYFDKNTDNLIKKLTPLRNKKTRLKEQLISQFNFNFENREGKSSQITGIKKEIEFYQESIKKYKKDIEILTKKNERIIEINKYLTQLRDICSKASSHDFGKEKLINILVDNKTEFNISFEQLYQIFHKNNLEFKEDEKLKEYQNIVQNYNEKINEYRKIQEILMNYYTIVEKISDLKGKIKNRGLKLDDFITNERQLESLEKEKLELNTKINNLEKDILECKKNLEKRSELIDEIENIPQKTALIDKLVKLKVKISRNEPLTEACKKRISKIKKQIQEDNNELMRMKRGNESILKELENTKNVLDHLNQQLKEVAEKFGYNHIGNFLDYYSKHVSKFKKYLENTRALKKRLEVLREDVKKVIEGVKPRNKVHLKIITDEFDKIFKELYGRQEFFEYVFKDYAIIKRFDIGNKTIIFKTEGGLEESRDLEEFSSGEKTYAYCRSIISMTANLAKYNIVILDESYALLDHEHSQNLYKFQLEMVQQGVITKFINILPLKEDLNGLINIVKKNLEKEKKEAASQSFEFLKSQSKILQSFRDDVNSMGYYQEIHYPPELRKELQINIGTVQNFDNIKNIYDDLEEELGYSFVLDGSNIARNNPNSKYALIRDVIKCRKKLQKYGVSEKNIFIIFGAGLRHYIPNRDKDIYEALLKEKTVNQAPAGRDDDWFIIKYAKDHNSYIITNDRYIQYREKFPDYENFLKSHCIRYSVIGNDIIFEEGFEGKLKKIIANNKK